MPPKIIEIDGKKYVELDEEKNLPIYIIDEKETPLDAESMAERISVVNKEAAKNRHGLREAEEKLKIYEGLDAEEARKALETMKNIEDKKLVDAGQVEKVKTEAIKAVEEKYKPVMQERDKYKEDLHREMIGGRFSRSKFIAEKMAVPVQMVEATFGPNFSIRDGKVFASDSNGNQIYSRANPGAPAEFDEALEIMVETSPFKDSIMKGRGKTGTGSGEGSMDTTNTPGKTIKRDEFDRIASKNTMEAHELITKGIKIID